VPNLIAFIVVAMLLTALARKAFRSPKSDEGQLHQVPAEPRIATDFPWVTTQIINMERNQQDMMRVLINRDGSSRLDPILMQLTELTDKVVVIDKMLRRRSGRSKKLTTGEE
jgi:hypothetical protein